MQRWKWLVGIAMLAPIANASAADYVSKMQKGNANLTSAGPIAFAPEGILLAADPKAASVVAIATGDVKPVSATTKYNVDGLDEKVAARLGIDRKEIQIVDMAVNPMSQQVYLSVARGRGPDAAAALLRVSPDGAISEVPTKDIPVSVAKLPNPADSKETPRGNPRMESITDLAFAEGKVYVAGLSNEEFASNMRALEFPFTETSGGSSIEIYHGAHGAVETRSPVRTFAAYEINGKDHLLAAYTCTPLVTIPIDQLTPGKKVRGKTVAELGNRNRPLDMVVYKKDGKNYVLMANSARGVMKIATESVASVESIEKKIDSTAGLPYETIDSLKGVEQLDRLNESSAVVISKVSDTFQLLTIALP